MARQPRRAHQSPLRPELFLPRLKCCERKSLLLGTALASTLLVATLAAPTPAAAVFTCAGDVGTGPAPISHLNINDSIICINTEARTNAAGNAITLSTMNDNHYLYLNSSGKLTATNAGAAFGIYTGTNGNNSPIGIINAGDIIATSTANSAYGIEAANLGTNSPISIVNSGDLTVTATRLFRRALGIYVYASGPNSPVSIVNSGDFLIQASGYAFGIAGRATAPNDPISIVNSGDMVVVSTDSGAFGLYGRANYQTSPLSILNSGNLSVMAHFVAHGIFGETRYQDSPVSIENHGDIFASGTSADSRSAAIGADTFGSNSPLSIVNTAKLTGANQAFGIYAFTAGSNGSPLSIDNSGDIDTTQSIADGIRVLTGGTSSPISVINSGDIATSHGPGLFGHGVYGVYARTNGADSPIAIMNSGKIDPDIGIGVRTTGANSPIIVDNSGDVYGSNVGIRASSLTSTTIVNTGTISAGSNFAIGVYAGPATIYNSGTVTGFVRLDADDKMVNQPGGTFEARQTSDFDFFGAGGTDLFLNQQGATVHALKVNGMQPSFVNLERFENQGLISTVNDSVGDVFRISNTVGGTNLSFVASNGSTLGVDAFLGGPGSTADNFIVDGSVSGKTELQVVDVNPGPGVLNKQGIPVVYVNGNVNANAFFLKEPIDTGFFDYDLFFAPSSGGGGVFSLKSFLGQGAFVLPQLATAAQDLWADGAETWFDRTADLRVLLNGGLAPAEADSKLSESGPLPPQITPAVWVRAGGSSLDRDASAGVSAFGNSYKFNLDRNLEAFNFEGGIDFGKRDLLAPGDILVFGLLGGGVASTLDYDKISRQFDLSGGEAGAYATYLKGGLFVDTLFKADLLTLDPKHETGFPGTLSANTFGLRTDSGYRFGGFHGGPFLEPLATIAAIWADLDGFSQGGNTVSFNDDANVRGRLGLRLGTDYPVWTGTTMEPFVIGSLWGNLSDNNQATLNSLGTTFQLEDKLQDVWGEVSGGVNFFNPSANTSAFAKVDVAFGNDIDGISGKAGMRVSW